MTDNPHTNRGMMTCIGCAIVIIVTGILLLIYIGFNDLYPHFLPSSLSATSTGDEIGSELYLRCSPYANTPLSQVPLKDSKVCGEYFNN